MAVGLQDCREVDMSETANLALSGVSETYLLFRLFKPMRIAHFQPGKAAGQVACPYGEGDK
jgi:hypothetical protein